MAAFVNYYELLHVDRSATSDQIRTAYKKESLRTHPDRLPPTATPQERAASTSRFQAVADAYYVLSDPVRKRDYDALLSSRAPPAGAAAGAGGPGGWADASAGFFQQFASAFARGAAPPGGWAEPGEKDNTAEAAAEEEEWAPEPEADASRSSWSGQQPDADATFTSVFEDLLRPEVASHVPWWTYVGSVSGAGLGYIIANVPGAMMGAYAGNRLGKIRDAKGKSVAQVFNGLGGNQKAQASQAPPPLSFAQH
ncbi:DnaJ-domain-containing protein [Calocera cornea HHB12733]|uniref:DnaJ-domain-containing protein n=1 Tax=Calocera cornea HHB12733 TaxID=1353952 RepID=A0A165FZ48_9BASI|nr:DnaJ-domain-containing protein [Calocera cornea HHB12733]